MPALGPSFSPEHQALLSLRLGSRNFSLNNMHASRQGNDRKSFFQA